MKPTRGSMKLELEGRGPVTIRPASDHVATGGEGSVYRLNDTIVKIYTDSKKMQRDSMPEKIELLSKIDNKFIVAPKGLVTSSGNPVGYYMDYCDGEHLSRIFTNDYRKRQNFTDKDASILVDNMRQTIECAHNHKAILVDANEMNWLVSMAKSGPEPRALDVDAWAIDKWPAKVIMPSIRDWHAKKFDKLTDWFSWGIVTFQIYTGIHPYKGSLNGYKRSDLEGRMKANASVFTAGIKLNRAVRDFNTIPGPLFDWYFSEFNDGTRSIPPSPFDTGVAIATAGRVLHATTTKSGMLIYDKLFGKTGDEVTQVYHCGVALLASGTLVDLSTKREIGSVNSSDTEVVEVNRGWLVASRTNRNLEFSYINKKTLIREELNLTVKGREFVRYENRLFVVTDKGLTELSLKVFGKPILSAGNTWGAMVNSTKWFDGIGVQDGMGATYLIAPYNAKSCAQIRVRELDGYRPIMARSGKRFIVLTAVNKTGNYKRFELTFDKDYKNYKIWQGDIDSSDLNIAILPKMVCASIDEDSELNIFVPSAGKLNKVQDKHISTDMRIANWEDKVIYIKDGNVWHVKMK